MPPTKDAVTVLTEDHERVKDLFTRYESLGKRAYKSKQALVERISEELSVHAAIEEEVLYPRLRTLLPDEEDDVLEALEEHHLVKTTLLELESLSAESERFHPKVTVLIEQVRHHIDEEEGEMFPHLREAVDREELVRIGAALEEARETAPTRPHPHAPDTPPGNIVANALAGPLDVVAGAGKWLFRHAREAPDACRRSAQLAQLGWESGRREVGERMRSGGRRKG
ncbi:MAG: hemerythrin domain-containing protein [Candidatus Dormibacteria bacterium]